MALAIIATSKYIWIFPHVERISTYISRRWASIRVICRNTYPAECVLIQLFNINCIPSQKRKETFTYVVRWSNDGNFTNFDRSYMCLLESSDANRISRSALNLVSVPKIAHKVRGIIQGPVFGPKLNPNRPPPGPGTRSPLIIRLPISLSTLRSSLSAFRHCTSQHHLQSRN
jgi:hypothetical protein